MGRATFTKDAMRSLFEDTEVLDELREGFADDSVLESFELAEGPARERENFDLVLAGSRLDVADEFSIEEAIVLERGRPALLVKDGTFETPALQAIKNRLEPHRDTINAVIPSVGRVELLNDASLDYIGTAWVIGDDVMMTNRHVANYFARRIGDSFTLRSNPMGEQFKARVDFLEEHEQKVASQEFKIKRVLHMEKDNGAHPDMALVQVGLTEEYPGAIKLATRDAERSEHIAVIGYPAKDSRNDAFVMADVFKNIYNVKRFSPGLVSGVRSDGFVLSHDCSTLGGSSGSVVIRIESGEAIGLHYAGSYKRNNFAVSASTLRRRLDAVTSRGFVDLPQALDQPTEGDSEVVRRAPTVSEMEGRKGYELAFLGFDVPLPTPSSRLAARVTEVPDNSDDVLDYVHYSVKMHRLRKMAIYTASNIDGDRSRRVTRTRDKWHYDPRIPKAVQLGDSFYRGTHLHRGHLVRRLDPAWGTKAAAKAAVADTFFWTNCTPQHRRFNPVNWLALEDYILENADNEDMKATVFTGPVLRRSDQRLRGEKVPKSYWKVVAFQNTTTDEPSATAYVVSQSAFMDDLEFVESIVADDIEEETDRMFKEDLEFTFSEFRTYQVPVSKVERLAHLTFGDLASLDPLSQNESAPVGHNIIETVDDIVL